MDVNESQTHDLQTDSIVDPLVRFAEEQLDAHRPTAPVRMPDPQDLEVRLVNINELHRLDELRSDASLLGGLFWIFVGGAVGFLGNLASSGQGLGRSGIIYIAFNSIMLAIFGALFSRANRRASSQRKRLLGETSRP